MLHYFSFLSHFWSDVTKSNSYPVLLFASQTYLCAAHVCLGPSPTGTERCTHGKSFAFMWGISEWRIHTKNLMKYRIALVMYKHNCVISPNKLTAQLLRGVWSDFSEWRYLFKWCIKKSFFQISVKLIKPFRYKNRFNYVFCNCLYLIV